VLRAGWPLSRLPVLDVIETIDRTRPGCRAAIDHPGHRRADAQRVGTDRAVLSVARKLLRRAHHTLRELGDEALARDA
jgi:transposase